jgi:uncharacterized heparinase superfamily protein
MDCTNPDAKAPLGHRHNSRLSYELFAFNQRFIVDPGTYLYTPDPVMRNLFRSTAYHNTVVVDSQEQNEMSMESLFTIGQKARVKVNMWRVTDEYDVLDAEHNGYQTLRDPVIHRRQVLFNKAEGYWIIRDILTAEGSHRFDLYFHFSPMDVTADKDSPLVVRAQMLGANLVVIPIEVDAVTLAVEKGWVSDRYGVKTEAAMAKYSMDGQAGAIFCNILYPYTSKIDISEVASMAKKIDLNRYFEGKL